MKILITGSSGFIGNYLLEHFKKVSGNQIIAAYRETHPKLDDPGAANVKPLKLDLSTRLSQVEPVDVVIHAAAHTNLFPGSTAEDYIKSNVIGTQNLADYAKSNGVGLFIYISTISMYGDTSYEELDEESPINNPSIYGLTKYMGEVILKEYSGDFPSLSIRLPGVVGPGYFRPWVGRVLEKALKNDPICIYNPAFKFNNVVHLADIARFITNVTRVGVQGFDNVNLATVEPMAIHDVAKLIVSLTDSQSQITEHFNTTNSFLFRQDKIKKVFQFQPDTTQSTIRRYVNENLDISRRPKWLGITG